MNLIDPTSVRTYSDWQKLHSAFPLLIWMHSYVLQMLTSTLKS